MPSLTGLFTNYGELGGVWFDGVWDKPDADWQIDRTYALLHRLQPGFDRLQPSPATAPRRRQSDLREGPSGRQHDSMGRCSD